MLKGFQLVPSSFSGVLLSLCAKWEGEKGRLRCLETFGNTSEMLLETGWSSCWKGTEELVTPVIATGASSDISWFWTEICTKFPSWQTIPAMALTLQSKNP